MPMPMPMPMPRMHRSGKILARLLRPKECALRDQTFQMAVNDLVFVGYPVTIVPGERTARTKDSTTHHAAKPASASGGRENHPPQPRASSASGPRTGGSDSITDDPSTEPPTPPSSSSVPVNPAAPDTSGTTSTATSPLSSMGTAPSSSSSSSPPLAAAPKPQASPPSGGLVHDRSGQRGSSEETSPVSFFNVVLVLRSVHLDTRMKQGHVANVVSIPAAQRVATSLAHALKYEELRCLYLSEWVRMKSVLVVLLVGGLWR